MSTEPEPRLRGVRRWVRRLLRRVWRPRVELVYHDKYNATFPGLPNDPLRGERILTFLVAEGLIPRCAIYSPKPVWLKTLARVHTAAYLDSVHDPAVLQSIFGTEITPDQADRMIDLQRLQTGGTLLATRLAWETRHIAVNLGGGFHHAYQDRGGGFCLFNDVAVAIAELRRLGLARRILVIDLDLHDGDGTRAIFADDPTVYTYSVHAHTWGRAAAASSTTIELGSKVDDATYLTTLEQTLPQVVASFAPEFVFFLAGCDPAHDDKLGNWQITARAMHARDQLVFAQRTSRGPVRGKPIPMVLLLAGGYSQEAWRYTARSLSELLRRGGPLEPPSTENMTLERYRYLANLFDRDELTGANPNNEFGFTEDDLFIPAWGQVPETRFLGYFTRHGVELILERSSFLDRLRDLGFTDPTLEFKLDDPAGHTIRIYGGPDKKEVLTELRVRRDRRVIPGRELLSIEWLLLQNPRGQFRPGRERLPGQEYPGLGLLKDVVAMLAVACELTHLDGLVFVPSQFHVAAQWRGHLFFLDREVQHRFQALLALFAGVPLAQASQAVAQGQVRHAQTGEIVRWRPEPMVLPTSERLQAEIAQRASEQPMADAEPMLWLRPDTP